MATEQTLKQWLISLSLSQYEANFIENGFERMSLVRYIYFEQDLLDIGIDKAVHRKAIMKALNISSLGSVNAKVPSISILYKS